MVTRRLVARVHAFLETVKHIRDEIRLSQQVLRRPSTPQRASARWCELAACQTFSTSCEARWQSPVDFNRGCTADILDLYSRVLTKDTNTPTPTHTHTYPHTRTHTDTHTHPHTHTRTHTPHTHTTTHTYPHTHTHTTHNTHHTQHNSANCFRVRRSRVSSEVTWHSFLVVVLPFPARLQPHFSEQGTQHERPHVCCPSGRSVRSPNVCEFVCSGLRRFVFLRATSRKKNNPVHTHHLSPLPRSTHSSQSVSVLQLRTKQSFL